ncbi:MAG: hypothetical protein V3T65_03580 [Acidobacteriota bacterium]
MHLHFSYHHVSRNPQLDHAVSWHVEKLGKFLVRFSPDLVHLRGILEFNLPHHEAVCSLNLWLPTARIHARERGASVLTVVQASFTELEEQVTRHKRVLRREGVWRRRRFKLQQEAEKLKAGELRVTDRQEMRDYLDQVLPQLEQFISRELRYLELAGKLKPDQPQLAEVVNEVVARLMANVKTSDEGSVPFHRLVSEVIQVLESVVVQPSPVATADSAKIPAAIEEVVVASELKSRSAAQRTSNNSGAGEPVAHASAEPSPVEKYLASLPKLKRQVYVLHALEGFNWEETAQVLGGPTDALQELFQGVSREVSAILRQAGREVAAPPRKVPA